MPQLRENMVNFINENIEVLKVIHQNKLHTEEWVALIKKAQDEGLYSTKSQLFDIKFGIMNAMKKLGYNVIPNYR